MISDEFNENSQIDVTITGPENATIYYSTDGSTPDEEANEYNAPFTVINGTTIKAIAVLNGVQSSVTTKLCQYEDDH